MTPVMLARAEVQAGRHAAVSGRRLDRAASDGGHGVGAGGRSGRRNCWSSKGRSDGGQPVARLMSMPKLRLALREAEANAATAAKPRSERGQGDAGGGPARMSTTGRNLKRHSRKRKRRSRKISTEAKNLPFCDRAAEARLQLARQDLDGKKASPRRSPGVRFRGPKASSMRPRRRLKNFEQRGPSLETSDKALAAQDASALHNSSNSRPTNTRALERGQANLAAAEAQVAQAKLAVETAKLRLSG